jgi:Ca2+-transporting ATPase
MMNGIPQIKTGQMNWHRANIEEVMDVLRTGPDGLTFAEAQKRTGEFGPNELVEMKKRSPFGILLSQFTDFMIIVLVLAAVISGVIGDRGDAVAILAIVVLNAVVGFMQEYRAENAIAALKEMAAPTATVIRERKTMEVPASILVPGDMVILEPGRIVPADMRIAESFRLRVIEAALTGEAAPVGKCAAVITEETTALGDRKNIAFKGTTVSYGRGKGFVVATGMSTEFGKIAVMLQKEKEVRTPLQKRLARFGGKLALFILAACLGIFYIGVFRGEPVLLMFLTAVSLAVAAIPEALPAVVTIALAIGAKNMMARKGLIRKLPAVETLGSVTYICSDKTGTLTQNRMSVEKMYTSGKTIEIGALKKTLHEGLSRNKDIRSIIYDLPGVNALMTAFALNNDATADGPVRPSGDPTEVALFNVARENGFDRHSLEKFLERTGEIPFDSERRCMTTLHKIIMPSQIQFLTGGSAEASDNGFISFTKGAVEVLIEKATSILGEEGVRSLDREELIAVNDEMASEGLRVLCIGMRRWETCPDILSSETVENGLTILGLAGMMDPPREEAGEAVALCKEAGIQVVMITGDHPATAMSIAKRLGISENGRTGIITGKELDHLSDDEFAERVGRIRVYARVAPEQKLKIIKALQDNGEFVAMTGDGINDAPALKRADIGVAMGVTGTDVAKESADMVLLDDNFASIVNAVAEGRKIYDNIRKFIKYLLTTNSGEVWTLFLAPVIGLPVPLLPIHILWINLITDGLPALALSAEPAEGDVMKRPPRPPGESIFSHGLGLHALWVGLLMGGTTLAVQSWSLRSCGAHWQTMVFTVLCLTQLGHVLAIRSETRSLFTMGLFSNKPLLGAVVCGLVLQLAVVYSASLNSLFKTMPLTAGELALVIALSSVIFFSVEVEKLVKRRQKISL